MSSKNKLQEIFQKSGNDLPIYSTNPVVSGFESSVTLPNGHKYTGKPASRKKDAELNAADEALKHEIKEKQQIISKDKIAVFIDWENQATSVKTLLDNYDQPVNMDFFTVASKNFPLKDIETNWIKKIIVNSSYRDSSDTMIIFMIGKLFTQYNMFIILTNDHFADSLVDIIREGSRSAIKVSSVDEIFSNYSNGS